MPRGVLRVVAAHEDRRATSPRRRGVRCGFRFGVRQDTGDAPGSRWTERPGRRAGSGGGRGNGALAGAFDSSPAYRRSGGGRPLLHAGPEGEEVPWRAAGSRCGSAAALLGSGRFSGGHHLLQGLLCPILPRDFRASRRPMTVTGAPAPFGWGVPRRGRGDPRGLKERATGGRRRRCWSRRGRPQRTFPLGGSGVLGVRGAQRPLAGSWLVERASGSAGDRASSSRKRWSRWPSREGRHGPLEDPTGHVIYIPGAM